LAPDGRCAILERIDRDPDSAWAGELRRLRGVDGRAWRRRQVLLFAAVVAATVVLLVLWLT
jgi:hypothetical protein